MQRRDEVTQHPHGPHECYCPNCDYTITLPAGEKCSNFNCPYCGSQLRAVEKRFEARIAVNRLKAKSVPMNAVAINPQKK